MDAIRSRKVRKILALEARAGKLEARHEQMLARVAPITARAEQLRHTAAALERQLTGSQLGALRRVRHPRA